MLPRWFRILLVVDLALLAAVGVLGARLALDGSHAAGRVITWARHAPGAAPRPQVEPAPPLTAAPPAPPAAPGRPPLGPALLHRLDSDTAASANAQRGLLGLLEEAIRTRIVDILGRVGHGGRGG
jgi:hypothetical protein